MIWPKIKRTSQKLKRPRAEKRGAVKLKTLQEKKKKSGTIFSFLAPLPNSASRFGGASCSFPRAGSYFRPLGRYSGKVFRGSELCFWCGKRGHWASSCPFKDKFLSSGSKSWLLGFGLGWIWPVRAGRLRSLRIQGNFRANFPFWRDVVRASEFVFDIIQNGYKILFRESPLPCSIENRSSALHQKSFVQGNGL